MPDKDVVNKLKKLVSDLNETIKCRVCSSSLKRPERIFCGHAFCSTCCQSLCSKSEEVQCPICLMSSSNRMSRPCKTLTLITNYVTSLTRSDDEVKAHIRRPAYKSKSLNHENGKKRKSSSSRAEKEVTAAKRSASMLQKENVPTSSKRSFRKEKMKIGNRQVLSKSLTHSNNNVSADPYEYTSQNAQLLHGFINVDHDSRLKTKPNLFESGGFSQLVKKKRKRKFNLNIRKRECSEVPKSSSVYTHNDLSSFDDFKISDTVGPTSEGEREQRKQSMVEVRPISKRASYKVQYGFSCVDASAVAAAFSVNNLERLSTTATNETGSIESGDNAGIFDTECYEENNAACVKLEHDDNDDDSSNKTIPIVHNSISRPINVLKSERPFDDIAPLCGDSIFGSLIPYAVNEDNIIKDGAVSIGSHHMFGAPADGVSHNTLQQNELGISIVSVEANYTRKRRSEAKETSVERKMRPITTLKSSTVSRLPSRAGSLLFPFYYFPRKITFHFPFFYVAPLKLSTFSNDHVCSCIKQVVNNLRKDMFFPIGQTDDDASFVNDDMTEDGVLHAAQHQAVIDAFTITEAVCYQDVSVQTSMASELDHLRDEMHLNGIKKVRGTDYALMDHTKQPIVMPDMSELSQCGAGGNNRFSEESPPVVCSGNSGCCKVHAINTQCNPIPPGAHSVIYSTGKVHTLNRRHLFVGCSPIPETSHPDVQAFDKLPSSVQNVILSQSVSDIKKEDMEEYVEVTDPHCSSLSQCSFILNSYEPSQPALLETNADQISGAMQHIKCESTIDPAARATDALSNSPDKNILDTVLSQNSVADLFSPEKPFSTDIKFDENVYSALGDSAVFDEDMIVSSTICRRLQFVGTNLRDEELQKMSELAKLLHISVASAVTEETTHVITRSDVPRMYTRTVKALKAIARHIYLLDYEWILQCLTQGRLVPEAEYEMQGELLQNDRSEAPKRARNSAAPLFRNFEVMFNGKFADGFSKEDLVELAELVGFRVVQTSCEFDSSRKKTLILIVDRYSEYFHKRYNFFYRELDVRTLSVTWLIDCITCYDILPFRNYALYDGETC